MKIEKDIDNMNYVEFMAFLKETNRPPGGKVAFKKMLDYCNITEKDRILDVGCNTGFCSLEAVRLKKCEVVGIDISPDMISVAIEESKKDSLTEEKTNFLVADAEKIPFKDNEFDFIFSGGSTAFMRDIVKALKEYKRVIKEWGFVGEINFYYKEKPSDNLIKELNNLMETNIEPWSKQRWVNLYKKAGLEIFDILEGKIQTVDDKQIERYVEELLSDKSQEIKTKSKEKLKQIMKLFNENHKYLAYGIFILRKRKVKEEPYLFAP